LNSKAVKRNFTLGFLGKLVLIGFVYGEIFA